MRKIFVAAVAVIVLVLAGPIEAQFDPKEVNRYLCYRVNAWDGGQSPQIKVRDQFGGSGGTLQKPHFLCNPVDFNGKGIADRSLHLVCYDLTAKIQSKPVRISNEVHTNTGLQLGGPEVVCLPSKKGTK
jgi:hypothetical protein